MPESKDDIARRVLASVLERLEARSGPRNSASHVELTGAASDDDPIVVVVLGGATTKTGDTRRIHEEASVSCEPNGAQPVAGIALHPGMEKFEVPPPVSAAGVLKTCFMEPDRPCVNSGACEMRGY